MNDAIWYCIIHDMNAIMLFQSHGWCNHNNAYITTYCPISALEVIRHGCKSPQPCRVHFQPCYKTHTCSFQINLKDLSWICLTLQGCCGPPATEFWTPCYEVPCFLIFQFLIVQRDTFLFGKSEHRCFVLVWEVTSNAAYWAHHSLQIAGQYGDRDAPFN